MYQGFVLPRMVLIDRNLSLPRIQDFQSSTYDIKNLELWTKNIIFTKVQQVERTNISNTQIPLIANILTDFNLDCLKSLKLSNYVCDKYISDFLKSFFVYKIDQDRGWFKEIFWILSEKENYKWLLCDGLKNYMLYTNDTSLELEGLFKQCGGAYENIYSIFRGFSDIQTQLYSYITDSIYTDQKLNAYKLLSTQQLIYNELSSNRFNQNRIDTYIKFCQELLKKPDTLERFYKDVMAFFNMRYLVPELSKAQFATTSNQIQLIKNTTNAIKELNIWSILIGFTGLSDQITQTSLLWTSSEEWIIASELTPEQQTLEQLFSQQITFPNLTITEKTYGSDTITIKGFFTVAQEKNTLQVVTNIKFIKNNNTLIIQSVNFEGYDKLNATIPTLLEKKQLWLNDIYETLVQNIQVLAGDQKAEATFCDSLETRLKDNLALGKIQSCNEGVTEIAIINIVYKFAYRDGSLIKIIVSNSGLQQAIDKKFWSIKTDTTTLLPTIFSILTYDPSQETANLLTGGLSAEQVLIYEHIVKYLGIKPTNIAQNNKNPALYLVEFTLQNFEFVGVVNINTLTISPLYFKKNTKYKFSNFSMPLDDKNLPTLNKFANDPIEFLKQLNPSLVEQYLKDTSF